MYKPGERSKKRSEAYLSIFRFECAAFRYAEAVALLFSPPLGFHFLFNDSTSRDGSHPLASLATALLVSECRERKQFCLGEKHTHRAFPLRQYPHRSQPHPRVCVSPPVSLRSE
jgi:hypothetical protein